MTRMKIDKILCSLIGLIAFLLVTALIARAGQQLEGNTPTLRLAQAVKTRERGMERKTIQTQPSERPVPRPPIVVKPVCEGLGDLTVTNISLSGNKVVFNYANIGNCEINTDEIRYLVKVNYLGDEETFLRTVKGPIATGANRTDASSHGLYMPPGRVTININPDKTVAESSFANNSHSKTWPQLRPPVGDSNAPNLYVVSGSLRAPECESYNDEAYPHWNNYPCARLTIKNGGDKKAENFAVRAYVRYKPEPPAEGESISIGVSGGSSGQTVFRLDPNETRDLTIYLSPLPYHVIEGLDLRATAFVDTENTVPEKFEDDNWLILDIVRVGIHRW